MGTIASVNQEYIRKFMTNQLKTMKECKSVINLDTFEGFTDELFEDAVIFFKNKVPVDHPFYKEICLVRDICKKKEEAYTDLAKGCIHKSLLELKLEPNLDLYLDLISFLIYKQVWEGK